MPLPKPQSGESRNEFVSRCMRDDEIGKFPTQEQRIAVCISQWGSTAKSEVEIENVDWSVTAFWKRLINLGYYTSGKRKRKRKPKT